MISSAAWELWAMVEGSGQISIWDIREICVKILALTISYMVLGK